MILYFKEPLDSTRKLEWILSARYKINVQNQLPVYILIMNKLRKKSEKITFTIVSKKLNTRE
jgi:hypothetical protein